MEVNVLKEGVPKVNLEKIAIIIVVPGICVWPEKYNNPLLGEYQTYKEWCSR